MRVAVIPARGGSKRIPRKNIRDFCGLPMIARSIQVARESGCFDHILVSTDDAEIAEVARTYGAEVPFLRPAALSDDYTGTIPVVAHAIGQLQQEGATPDEVCCIYATAPFIQADDLRQGLNLLRQQQADYAFSVTSYPFPIQRAVRINAAGQVEMFQPEHFATRSQDLEEAYHDAGQFYWGRAQAWLTGQPVFAGQSVPVLLPRSRVQDIDTPEDWVRAEILYRLLEAQQ
ncbi:pseudaminic acid cytidylyltransferase [Aeromonas media]